MFKRHLGIFARTPVAGSVKTRLTPPLSPDEAAALYRAFLTDLFTRLLQMKNLTMTVYHAEAEPGALAELVPSRARLAPQSGETLGARMNAAINEQLARAPQVGSVLIGSDSPDIPIAFIKRGFMKLKHHDVVLGPSSDGGYYLIGMRNSAPEVFAGVQWSESTVFAQTVENVRRAGLSLAVLPLWYDVDNVASLELLQSLIAARRSAGNDSLPATAAVIETLSL